MLKEKIEKYFQQFPTLKVLFFFDDRKEREEEVDELEIKNIRIVKWANNDFYLKSQFYGEWSNDKIFLYFPKAAPKNKKDYKTFPLLGLLIANKELSLDNVGEFMDEFQLQKHQKSLVSKYMKELQYSNVKEVCRPILKASAFEERVLIQGLISAFLRFSSITPWAVIIGKLLTLTLSGQEEELTRFQNKIKDNDLLDLLLLKTKEYFEVVLNDLTKESLFLVLRKIYYNRIVQTITNTVEEDPYRELKILKPDTLVYFNQFLQEVDRNPRVQEKLENALALVGKDIQGTKLIAAYGQEAEFTTYADDMLWEIMALDQTNLSIKPTESIRRLEQLSLQEDLSPVIVDSLQFMIYSSQMFEKINSINKFILDSPDAYIHTYVEDWMYIDLAYRKAITIYRFKDLADVPEKLNLESIHKELNDYYERFLDNVNREWLKCLYQFGFDYGKIAAPKQYDFYQLEVAPYDQKVVVIISDALRYEVAAELMSEMHGDPKNTATIRHQLASIPSKTFIGMAQLLPHKELIFDEEKILVDKLASNGIPERQKILASYEEGGIAIKYSDMLDKTKEELRAIFKNRLVYVYHNEIDKIGDDRASEHNTFEAVDRTIEVLQKLIKSLHATYNVAKVIITSDHGFVYNDRKIDDKDKEPGPNGNTPSHNRYDLTSDGKTPKMGYKIPLGKTTKFKEIQYVTIPESVNRYKKQGVGHQFIHGGGSLQELIVPIVESSRKRKEVTKKVNPVLVYKGRLQVVSNILRTNILQENKVSRFEKELNLTIGLYKDLELVSNEQTIVMNSTSEAPSERIHRIELTLNQEAAKESFLKLKVFDEEDKLNALIEELVQNNTLIQTDF